MDDSAEPTLDAEAVVTGLSDAERNPSTIYELKEDSLGDKLKTKWGEVKQRVSMFWERFKSGEGADQLLTGIADPYAPYECRLGADIDPTAGLNALIGTDTVKTLTDNGVETYTFTMKNPNDPKSTTTAAFDLLGHRVVISLEKASIGKYSWMYQNAKALPERHGGFLGRAVDFEGVKVDFYRATDQTGVPQYNENDPTLQQGTLKFLRTMMDVCNKASSHIPVIITKNDVTGLEASTIAEIEQRMRIYRKAFRDNPRVFVFD